MDEIRWPERREAPFDPIPKGPSPSEEGGGPTRPDTGSPERDNLLKRMRKVDPKQAERYRQRTGE
ncbi:MAG: ubiquitin-like protein UBact [Nitrospiraceae bacterium]